MVAMELLDFFPLGFFISILLPNFLRQAVYYMEYTSGKTLGFVDSIETRWFMRKGHFFIGYFEELLWALLWTHFWFNGVPFPAIGWVFDAFQDILIALYGNPYLFFDDKNVRMFLREILVPYILPGIIWFALDINNLYYFFNLIIPFF